MEAFIARFQVNQLIFSDLQTIARNAQRLLPAMSQPLVGARIAQSRRNASGGQGPTNAEVQTQEKLQEQKLV